MITRDQGLQIIKNISMFGLEEAAIDSIVSLLELADDLYYNDDPILEDSEYDVIYRFAKNYAPTDAYFLGVGSSVRGGKVTLPFTMGSLNQIYEGDLQNWINKWSLYQTQIGVISDKLDGTSGLIVYDANGKFQISYSRGDGVLGADTSRILSRLHSVPKSIMTAGTPFVVRGENIISIKNFPKLQEVVKNSAGKKYKNARNAVSGLLNASTMPTEAYKFIDFVAYEIVGSSLSKLDQFNLLVDLGFQVPHRETEYFENMSDNTLTNIIKNRKRLSEYEIDGIVVDVNSAAKRSAMNQTRSTLNPVHTIKYKVADADNYAEVVVEDVTFSISKHGYLKPTIRLTPTDLVGVTISNCTGFNAKFIKDNHIGPGSVIGLTRSGDVIPFCSKVIKPMPVEIYDDWFFEKVRPFGNSHWTVNAAGVEVDLVLDDADLDPTAKYERLVDFFNTIDAPHLGEGNLQKIFDMGFETPESVITLTQEDFGCILNSQTMGKKIFQGLKEKLTNIPIYKLMGAYPSFGRGVGVRKMKLLYDAFEGDMAQCFHLGAIMKVSGFEEKTAKKIQAGYQQFADFLMEVRNNISLALYEAPKVGKFTDIVVVFTGFRDKTLEAQIVEQGGKVGSDVSSKTGLVVTLDPNGSSGKLKKARKLNIDIIVVETLKSLLVK
jgi:NAD-dependent DNA ligase